MLEEAFLEDGGRGLAQALLAAAATLICLVALAVFLPVAILALLSSNVAGGPGLAAPPVVAPALRGVTAAEQAPAAGQPLASPSGSAVDVARRYLGVPYVFGGTNPAVGLDCSGLVQLVFRQLGVALPRTAQQQYAATAHLTAEQLQPGDLVFFARTYDDPHDWVTHVGIYIGNGQQINAPTEGQRVSIQPVFSGFWGAHFIGGGRVRAA